MSGRFLISFGGKLALPARALPGHSGVGQQCSSCSGRCDYIGGGASADTRFGAGVSGAGGKPLFSFGGKLGAPHGRCGASMWARSAAAAAERAAGARMEPTMTRLRVDGV